MPGTALQSASLSSLSVVGTGFEPVYDFRRTVLQFAKRRPSPSLTVPFCPVLNCVCSPQVRSGGAAPHPVQPCWVAIGLQP